MKEGVLPSPPQRSGSVKYAQKNHEHKEAAAAPQPSTVISQANGSSVNTNGNGNLLEAEGVVPLPVTEFNGIKFIVYNLVRCINLFT